MFAYNSLDLSFLIIISAFALKYALFKDKESLGISLIFFSGLIFLSDGFYKFLQYSIFPDLYVPLIGTIVTLVGLLVFFAGLAELLLEYSKK